MFFFQKAPFSFPWKALPSDLVCRVVPLRGAITHNVESPQQGSMCLRTWSGLASRSSHRNPHAALPPSRLVTPPQSAMSPRSHLRRVGERPAPGPSLLEPPGVLTKCSELWEQRRSRGRGGPPCGQVGPQALPFRWGRSTKGPLSSASPGRRCIVPPRSAQWDIVQSRKGPLVQPPAPRLWAPSSGLPRVGEATREVCLELMFSCPLQGPPS